jgi:hypothetical protein
MAESRRVRIDNHLEAYLAEQAERVLGKPGSKITGAELTTLVNTVLYEHKLAHQAAQKIPFARIFNWFMSFTPGAVRPMAIVPDEQVAIASAEPTAHDFSSLTNQFEEDFEEVAKVA